MHCLALDQLQNPASQPVCIVYDFNMLAAHLKGLYTKLPYGPCCFCSIFLSVHLCLNYLLHLMAGARVVVLAAQQQEGSNRHSNLVHSPAGTQVWQMHLCKIETELSYYIVVGAAAAVHCFVPSLPNRQINPPFCVLFPWFQLVS